jgi:hypothetical protein
MVIAPEHPYLEQWKDKITNYDEIVAYQRRPRENPILSVPSWSRTKPALKSRAFLASIPLT